TPTTTSRSHSFAIGSPARRSATPACFVSAPRPAPRPPPAERLTTRRVVRSSMAKPPRAAPSLRLATLCIDCADADAMADFYGRLLGWEATLRTPGWVLMRDPAGGTGLS